MSSYQFISHDPTKTMRVYSLVSVAAEDLTIVECVIENMDFKFQNSIRQNVMYTTVPVFLKCFKMESNLIVLTVS